MRTHTFFGDRVANMVGLELYVVEQDFKILMFYLLPEVRDYRNSEHTWFMWYWGFSPRPCACWVNNLPAELHPHPFFLIFI